MEPVDDYADFATWMTRSEFSSKLPHPFLVKLPNTGSGASEPITFRTRAVPIEENGLISDLRAFDECHWVWPLKKKPSSPFQSRMSVGRAPNCDVVLRLSYVSKLHAHVRVEGPRSFIVDLGSSNGTEVNGRKLSPNAEQEIRSGDKLKFGALELQLLDPGMFYDLLTRRIR